MASSPHAVFGVTAAAMSLGTAAALAPHLHLSWAWLTAVSIVTVLLHGYDKAVSGTGATRVPESVIFTLSAAGGALACLAAMLAFRHKTRKASFQGVLVFILLVQGAVAYALL